MKGEVGALYTSWPCRCCGRCVKARTFLNAENQQC